MVRLRLATDFLEGDDFGYAWAREDPVTALATDLGEAEGADERDDVAKEDIRHTSTHDFREQF
ncbi:MAG: hypothetical protein ABSA93_10810 [Streptosporangiaceae bacterium]